MKLGWDDIRTETVYPHLAAGESLELTATVVDSLFGHTVFKHTKAKLGNKKIILYDRKKNNKLRLVQNKKRIEPTT